MGGTKMLLSVHTVAQALGGEVTGGQVLAPGPGHSEQDRSLSIKVDPTAPDGFVVHSFARDDPIKCRDHVREKLNLPPFQPAEKKHSGNTGTKPPFSPVIARYTYRDANGAAYLQVQRTASKQFRQYHWTGDTWRPGKPKGPKIPYRLPQLLTASTSTPVYVCEGEKDADNLSNIGFVATTASEGAEAKWSADLNKWFKDRTVYVLPDNDEAGRRHAQDVAHNLDGMAAKLHVVELPNLPHKGDVSDWLKDDPTGARLVRECKAAPIWEPRIDTGSSSGEEDTDPGIDPVGAVSVLLMKQADALIELAQEAELFHTPGRDGYADLNVGDHRETHRLRSRTFRAWLNHRFYQVRSGAPSSEAMNAALGVLEARALFDGPERPVHVRVAHHEGTESKFYLDLADDDWRVVEIDGDGWRIISSPPVRFRRAPGMLPLPEPMADGSIEALRALINVEEKDFALVEAWLLAALRPAGPYPVLAVAGEQGSTKSTLSALSRGLVDPNVAPLRALPRDDRDLFIAANNGHVLVFDNVSGLPMWLSDTLCRLATGGGFATRQLYTDDGEMLFDAMRPIILNGIEDVAVRPDLVDRSLMLTLPSLDDKARRPEKELWAAFAQDRAGILGVLLDAMVLGLGQLDQVRIEKLPRMADFFAWVSACEPALWPAGTFADAYQGNRVSAIGVSIEADLVATAVSALMATRDMWVGSATELLTTLGLLIDEAQRRTKAWPSLPHLLGGRLTRVAPMLRKVGIEVQRPNREAAARSIILKRVQPDERGK
jgi:5S rRNA maturation endonuclease (ribonuclease M5)